MTQNCFKITMLKGVQPAQVQTFWRRGHLETRDLTGHDLDFKPREKVQKEPRNSSTKDGVACHFTVISKKLWCQKEPHLVEGFCVELHFY